MMATITTKKKEYIRDKEHLNIGTLGHIDHGKTSLTAAICRYLSLLDPEKNEYITYDNIDKAPEERKRGITINASVVRYETPLRHIGHVDCPGHADYVKNMITGASQLDGAILVIARNSGPAKQTYEHLLLASKLGLKKLIVFWNKIDLPYDEEMHQLAEIDFQDAFEKYGFNLDYPVIEGSALAALNASNDPNDPAYIPIKKLIEQIDSYFDSPQRDIDSPVVLPIESILSITGRGTVVTGKIEKGKINTGDTLELIGYQKNTPAKIVTCKEIETFRTKTAFAIAGDNVGMLVSGIDKENLLKGQVLCAKGKFSSHSEFKALVYILTENEGGRKKPFFSGYEPQFFIRTADVTGTITLPEDVKMVAPGDEIEVTVKLQKDVCLNERLSFTMREGGITVGAGFVLKIIR